MRDVLAELAARLRAARRHAADHGLPSTLRSLAARPRDPRSPPDGSYRRWLAGRLAPPLPPAPPHAPRLSLLVPVRDPPPGCLAALLDSLRPQAFEDWELLLCDDGSSAPGTADELARLAAADARVRRLRSPGRGIAQTTNAAAEAAGGEVLLLVDHDDALAPGALGAVARAFAEDAALELLTTDADELDTLGARVAPVFRPGPSPWLALGFNYAPHLLAVRRDLWRRLQGLRAEFDGAQDHDLLLRALEQARRARHLREVAYHWRRAPGSVARRLAAKEWAFEAGRRAVADACRRRGLRVADIRAGARPGTWELVPERRVEPLACDVVLRGPERGLAAWRLLFSREPLRSRLDVRAVWRNAFPDAPSDPPRPLLLVHAALRPEPAALEALLDWSGLPGWGALAASPADGRRRSDAGWSVTRAGRAEPLLAGLPRSACGPSLLAACAREVAAAGGGLGLVAPPPPWWWRAAARAPATLAGELVLSLAHAPQGRPCVWLPSVAPRWDAGSVPRPAPVDLSLAAGWSEVRETLPDDFWLGAADRFAPRHELLEALGLPGA